MNNGAFGQPRPLGYPIFPRPGLRYFNPAYVGPYPPSTTTPPVLNDSQRPPHPAPFGVPSLGLNPGLVAPSPFVPSLPMRLAYPPGGASPYVPNMTYVFPASTPFGAAMTNASTVSAGVMRPNFVQPIHQSAHGFAVKPPEISRSGKSESRRSEKENDSPRRLAFPPGGASPQVPNVTYVFPASAAFGAAMTDASTVATGSMRPNFIQPIHKSAQGSDQEPPEISRSAESEGRRSEEENDSSKRENGSSGEDIDTEEEDEDEDEEEIDVVGGIEDDDSSQEVIASANGATKGKGAEEDKAAVYDNGANGWDREEEDDDDDDNDDEGGEDEEVASSDEDWTKREAAVEEDGEYDGETDISTNSSGDASKHDGEPAAEGDRKNFPCKSCPKIFQAKHSLKRHVKEIHEGIRFQCPKCFECYTRMTSYNQHVCHANWRKAKARQIDSKYNMGKARRSYKPGPTKPADTICPVCEHNFPNSMSMNRHLLQVHEKLRYSCPVCGESYARIEGYRKHRCGSNFRKAKQSAVEDFLANSRPAFDFSAAVSAPTATAGSPNLFSQANAFNFTKLPTAPSTSLSTRNSTQSEALITSAATTTLRPSPLEDSEASRNAIVRRLDNEDSSLESLVEFVYSHFPPKDKRRFGADDLNRFQLLSLNSGPDSRKKLKHLLLKVLQDYHPDKVDAIHGAMWSFACNEISKRLNFHFENFK